MSEALDRYFFAVRSQFEGRRPPNSLEDIAWYREYINLKPNGPSPVLLSMGENWEGPPSDLRELERMAPDHCHGYQFGMRGDPSLVEALESYFLETYVPGQFSDWLQRIEVAAVWSGTRGVIFDLGRHFGGQNPGKAVVYASPSYDYGTVMCGSGLRDCPVSVLDPLSYNVEYGKLIDAIGNNTGALVINAQHNPLAHQIPPDILLKLFNACIERDIPIIFDDAHFAIVEPAAGRVNAVKLWLETINRRPSAPRWVLVRSFGKQLNCNGWGVGMMAGSPSVVDALNFGLAVDRQYTINGSRQWAMGRYIASGQMDREGHRLAGRVSKNRRTLEAILRGKFPLRGQDCTAFSWFELPAGLSRRDIMHNLGVLLGSIHPSPKVLKHTGNAIAKIYLGVHESVFNEAIERLEAVL